jgi:hypothetical protein
MIRTRILQWRYVAEVISLFRQLCNLITCDLAWLSKATIATMLIMTKTIVHWTEDMIQSRHPLLQLYSILRIALRSCYWQNHFIEYPSKIWTFTKSPFAHAFILIIVLVFILKNHFIVLVLLIRSRLIMTKTFVHWTEDMIQSRHRLAQNGILRIALRSCYWQNHFIEYSCYLQNHLWTTAELTI